MIDYAKIRLLNEDGARLLGHHELSFRRPVDELTGELNETDARCADHHGLTFTHYPSGYTTLHGSIHKYRQGGTNSGDFTFTEFQATIAELCERFDLDPANMHLLQLEAGVNIVPPISTPDALKAIVCHREGHAFSPMRTQGGTSLGLELYRDQYGIKIYDKGRQYGLPGDLLRFEVKFTKGKPLNSLRIHNMGDLLNLKAWDALRIRVLGIFDELHITEPGIRLHRLSISQRTFCTLATTPAYWQGRTRGQRYKDRGRYDAILDRQRVPSLKDALRVSIEAKFKDLQRVPVRPFTGPGVSPPMGDTFPH
jgi:hypothetical protein